MISDTNPQLANQNNLSSSNLESTALANPGGRLKNSSSSTNAIQEQFETLKQLLRGQLDESREQVLRSEELERESEHIRLEKEVQRDEMKNYLHGALEARKSLSSLSGERAKSEAENLETVLEAIEESHQAQMTELRGNLEANVMYKRQKHGEQLQALGTRHRSRQ